MKQILLTAIILLGQLQGTTPTANGTIEGSVTHSGTGRPLEGVLVVADAMGTHQASTDSSGHFSIKNIPAGRYFVIVQDQRYARPPKGGYSKTVVVGAGETVRNVDLTMLQTGIVSGRVLRPDGQAVVGAEVAAIIPDYRAGQIILPGVCCSWRTARTDATGAYRISTVEPGEYYVLVQSESYYKKPYFPGTADPQVAQRIVVTQGTETVANIQYQTVATFIVAGRIVDEFLASGTHQLEALYLKNRNIRVRDDPSSDEFSSPSVTGSIQPGANTNANTIISASQDQFEIHDVRPGLYDLFAKISVRGGPGTSRPETYAGRIEIDVKDRDIAGVRVVVHPGVDVEMIATNSPYDYLRLVPRDNTHVPASAVGIPLGAEMDPDGKIRVHNVSPGIYSLRMDQPSSTSFGNSFLADVRQNGKSVFDSGFVVGTTTVSPIEVSVSDKGGSIQGTVQSSSPVAVQYAKISLVPELARRENVQLYKWVIADVQGRFTIRGIAPGDYKLFAFEDAPLGALQNADFIARHESGGVPIHVAPGASLTMQPPLVPMP